MSRADETLAQRVLDAALVHAGRDSLPSDPIASERIRQALDECNGVLEDAWRALGLKNRHALKRLVVKLGIDVTRRPSRRSRRPSV